MYPLMPFSVKKNYTDYHTEGRIIHNFSSNSSDFDK